MPDDTISQLPAVTAVVASDLSVAVASSITSKITAQQLINALVSFIAANVNIGGGAIILQGNGSASFASGAVTISASGTVSGVFPPPGIVNPNGNVTAAPGATYFNTANSTFWVQASAVVANTGWVQLI